MASPRQVEICAETLQACEAARAGGADRIELCSALSEGGVTPSVGLLRAALKAGGIPVHALLRPRGGDFVYSQPEFEMICDDLKLALDAGAAGVVVGCLHREGNVDRDRTRRVVELAEGAQVTFHRAFDQTPNQILALEEVISSGCTRVLTSGGKPTVTEGRAMLIQLTQAAGGRIRIAAGGGVTLQNAKNFASIPSLDLHASLKRRGRKGGELDILWQSDAEHGQISADDVRSLSGIAHEHDSQ